MILFLIGLAIWVGLIIVTLIFFKGAHMIDGCNNDCNQGRACGCSKASTPNDEQGLMK